MAHIENVPANVINVPSSEDSSSTTGIVSPGTQIVGPLEFNQSIVNLTVLSDISSSMGGPVEDSNELSSFHSIGGTDDSSKGGEGMDHDSSIVRGLDVGSHPPYSPL